MRENFCFTTLVARFNYSVCCFWALASLIFIIFAVSESMTSSGRGASGGPACYSLRNWSSFYLRAISFSSRSSVPNFDIFFGFSVKIDCSALGKLLSRAFYADASSFRIILTAMESRPIV